MSPEGEPVEREGRTDAESHFIEELLNDAATIPSDSDADAYEIQLPPWYDEAKFKRGQQFYWRNNTAAVTAAFCGLISVLAIPSILEVLIFTKRSSIPITAYKRYVLTVLHAYNWYFEDLKPGSKSWKSIQYVRRIHAVSSKQANAHNSKMLVTQKDMAITQFGFVGYVVLSHKKLGIHDDEGLEAFIHLWRTIGYMLGIEDRFNLCTGDAVTSKRRMTLVLEQILRPALQTPSPDFVHMAKAMIDGMWHYTTMLEYDAFMFLTRRLAGVPGHYYWDSDPRDGVKPIYLELGWYSRFMLNVSLVLNEVLMQYDVLRWFLNWFFYFNTYIVNKYFPWLAMLKFGIKTAYVKIVY